MTIREYDAIITNFEGTGFTAYYTKGTNLKLSDGTTVVNVYKPGKCECSDEKCFQEAMIEMSGNGTNRFHYQDLLQIQRAIESAIDFLNKENENIIDRNKECSYEKIEKQPIIKKKTTALKYKELEIGGIYKDNKDKEWIFLGEADLYNNNRKSNRGGEYSGTECRYIYMPNTKLTKALENWFQSEEYLGTEIDSYASKKRFFEKVGQLEVTPNMSITFFHNDEFHSVYGKDCLDKEENEAKIAQVLLEGKRKKEAEKEQCERKFIETVVKVMNGEEAINIQIDFQEDEKLFCKVQDSKGKEEFTVSGLFVYQTFFFPLLKNIVASEQGQLENIQHGMSEIEGREDIMNYDILTSKVKMHLTNLKVRNAQTIKDQIEYYLEECKENEKRGVL